MNKDRVTTILLVALGGLVLLQLAVTLSGPASAYDSKVGSDSAVVSVATSGDGTHVYVCDGKRCYASHDGGKTFLKLKVE